MIQENDIIPKFKLDITNPILVSDSEEFHKRILEFIEKNINGKINHSILCYFVSMDGTQTEAELPRRAFNQALLKSLEFFTEIENYENCKIIKELTEKI
jgi:hypothetical protein